MKKKVKPPYVLIDAPAPPEAPRFPWHILFASLAGCIVLMLITAAAVHSVHIESLTVLKTLVGEHCVEWVKKTTSDGRIEFTVAVKSEYQQAGGPYTFEAVGDGESLSEASDNALHDLIYKGLKEPKTPVVYVPCVKGETEIASSDIYVKCKPNEINVVASPGIVYNSTDGRGNWYTYVTTTEVK